MEFEFKVNKSNFDKLGDDYFSLDYHFLLSDVLIKNDFNFININFNIPLLDFANGISIIMNEFINEKEGKQEFDFTEGEGLLIFTKNDKELIIFLDYDDSSLKVNFDDFCRATKDLNRKIKNFVSQEIDVNKFPELNSLLDGLSYSSL